MELICSSVRFVELMLHMARMVESLNSQSLDTLGSRFGVWRCYQVLLVSSRLSKTFPPKRRERERQTEAENEKITKILAFASLAQAKSICPVAIG